MKNKSIPRVAIIGAGVAGIAASIRLAVKGYEVRVYEANAYPGGKLSEIQLDNFRFDAGPSLFTLPELVDELFDLAGKNPKQYFQYQKLNTTCRYFYEDGTIIEGHADKEVFAEEVFRKTGEAKSNIIKALRNSNTLYDLLADLFMKKSLHSWRTFFNRKAFKAYFNFYKLDFFRSMNASNEQQFKNKKVIQLFNRYATYNGSDPYQIPATFNIIPHLEFNLGAFFPTKGMYSITQSLYNLALELGVQFNFNKKVDLIVVENERVTGIEVQNTIISFDKVISNMDMVNTYKKLLPQKYLPPKLLNQPKSSSALIFYWGVKKQFPQLDLHNIFFSKNYKAEFEHIFKKKNIFSDPTVYLNITSKYKSDDAPEGCENWFTMINVPNNSGQDWDELIKGARRNIINKMSGILKEDIEALIICEAVLDPRTIESRTSSSLGALYGNSSNNKFAAFLRHPNFSSKIKNLFFCGGSVHPGGGIPLCLLSAKITADLID
ncbi:MAG: phytoene desaturase family protein [Bacteroidota bacterium]|nr:phytoene desaturase family protein [Bacteroidota bacterium]